MTELQLTILTPHLPPDISVKSGHAGRSSPAVKHSAAAGLLSSPPSQLSCRDAALADNPVHSVAATEQTNQDAPETGEDNALHS